MKHIVIIGAGITGLAAAHRLLERSQELRDQVQVTLLEASPRPGGIVQTSERDGFLLEGGPDSFISEKPEALDLTRRLGLESQLIETNRNHRRSFIESRGRLRPVPQGFHLMAPGRLWPFVTSDIFSLRGKARMAMDLVVPRRNGLRDESLAEFVRRRLGREALERMAQPMIGGIYTGDPEKLSLRATMPRFLEMESEHGSIIRALMRQGRNPVKEGRSSLDSSPKEGPGTSGARYSLFLSFDRGMQMLTDKLAERILNFKSPGADGNHPISIRFGAHVESLGLQQSLPPRGRAVWKIGIDQNETVVADAICLALPTFVSARLVRDVDEQLASDLDSIPVASSATINLAYRREDIPHPLDGFGFVVPYIERRSLIACTFNNVKFPGRAPAGHELLRAFIGGALQPEMLTLDEVDVISRVRNDLRDLLGIEKPPLFTEFKKWERSMPQYHIGHIERVERIQKRVASLPGLALAGSAYSGPGIPDCIRSGETAADRLLEMLAE